jgi:hypothetical protein
LKLFPFNLQNLKGKIPNSKSQIPNKFQIPIPNDPNEAMGQAVPLWMPLTYLKIDSFGI